MRILTCLHDADLGRAIDLAADRIHAEVVPMPVQGTRGAEAIGEEYADLAIIELRPETDLDRIRTETTDSGTALLALCHDSDQCRTAIEARVDDWVLLPAEPDEIALRITGTRKRAVDFDPAAREERRVELLQYEELLYDRLTGFPTLPVVIRQARDLLSSRGELTILYIHFIWYSRIEEIYGWQKLDDVLETTAGAVRDFYTREHPSTDNYFLVSHVADNDFILFTHLPTLPEVAERQLKSLAVRLEEFLRERVERVHGQDIAALCGVYVGTSSLFRNPKIRIERLVYRGIREAANAARGAIQWEQTSKIADLQATIEEGAVYMEYHPILITRSEEIYGFEALARGAKHQLRSPEVLFEVAAEANLLWELGRLLRTRALEEISNTLRAGQFLFLNVDPHDFDDPQFRDLDLADHGLDDPEQIVLEITERTAIKDYPRFQQYLAAFRERGFRFAVDDAGSGYAGLGSIANLEPDYIKLDISLISNIDTNFLKQNLVETMVDFAENHGVQVIAEGVERREEFETIRDIGVHLAQGFLFHRPQSAEAIARI